MFQNKNDYLIVNNDSLVLRGIEKQTKAKLLKFSVSETNNAFIENGVIVLKDNNGIKQLIDTKDITLIGGHNLYNIMAAALAAKSLGIGMVSIKKGIETFKPLPVRLEVIGKFKGIKFVLDALATIPEATIAALNSYSGRVGTLICGGFDRGQDFKELAKEIVRQKVENLVLFPTTGEKIWREVEKLQGFNKPNHFNVLDMENAVKISYQYTLKGKICLLSAASSSFSVFKNYEEESELFRQYVKVVGVNPSHPAGVQ